MKKMLTFACMLSATIISVSYAQGLTIPQSSPTAEIKQNFGLSQITVSYSRPGIKGRKIFGDLVPYDKVWRTGANQATTITFGDDVTINGTKVPAGKYGLLSIPGQSNWTVIISKQTDVTSAAAYKQDQDVVRLTVKPEQLPFSLENFTIEIADITSDSCTLQLLWDNVYVPLIITTDVDTRVMAQIKQMVEGDSRPYYQAAVYYIENNKDLNQAVTWLDKGIAQNPQAFYMYYQKARALGKLGKKQDALTASNKSIELAKAAQNDDYVALNEKLQKSL